MNQSEHLGINLLPDEKKIAKKQEIFPLNSLFGVKDHLGHLLFCDDKKILLLYT